MTRGILITFLTFTGVLIFLSAGIVGQSLAEERKFVASRPSPVERIDLLETIRNSRIPQAGQLASDLDVKDEVGARFRLQLAGDTRPQLFGAFCTCAACRETAQGWAALVRKYPARFRAAALVSLPRGEQLFAFHDGLALNFPLIPDPDHSLSARYPGDGNGNEAIRCPRAWVIGGDGRYRYVMPPGKAPTATVLRAMVRALGLPAEAAKLATIAHQASAAKDETDGEGAHALHTTQVQVSVSDSKE